MGAIETTLANLMDIDSLASLIRELDSTVETSHKNEIAKMPDEGLFKLHFGVNALIRSLAYYGNSSHEGRALFDGLGLPDDGSAVLGRIYRCHLRGEPVNRESLIPLIDQHALFISGAEAESLAGELAQSYATLYPPKK